MLAHDVGRRVPPSILFGCSILELFVSGFYVLLSLKDSQTPFVRERKIDRLRDRTKAGPDPLPLCFHPRPRDRAHPRSSAACAV